MSGFMFPFHGMPAWAQDLGILLPMTHSLWVVRAVMLKGANWSEIGFEFAMLATFIPVLSILALLRFSRTLDWGLRTLRGPSIMRRSNSIRLSICPSA